MKNYLDAGKVTQELVKEQRLLQEVTYFDQTVFRGQMGIEEESNIAFKDGFGKLVRGTSTSYYQSIKGQWTRGMVHGKRIKTVCNLDVFPKGYY